MPPLDVLVVPHTHWDREWYQPAGRFRQRLVALVDELLDAIAAGDGQAPPSFLLDGQAVVLDDYLAVRPERRGALAAALRDGRLEAGPWYVLADTLIPGAEPLVRNLLAGRRAVRALGAEPPPVLYCPDSFGHPAALPALAAGFGLDLVVAWRGYGGARWPAGDAAWWQAPDGGRALLLHLPPDGYEFGSRLPPALPSAQERWAAARAVLAARARLGVALVMNGADHHALQERWGEALDALARAAAPEPARAASLGEVARLTVGRARALDGTPEVLPAVAGELRDSYGYAWTLQGTFASRAAQKRRAARAAGRLVRDVEPWVALAALAGRGAGGDALGDAGRRGALLRAAWRPLLECLPHDTLCGCSTDEVARAADARLEDCAAQARGLRDDALAALLGHDPDRARRWRDGWRPAAVVRNRAARARGGVAEVELLTFVRDVPVGPGSAGAWREAAGLAVRGAPVTLDGGEGLGPVPVQVLDRALRHDRVEAPRHYPDVDLVEAARCVAWVPPVAGYGVRAFALGEGAGDDAARARAGAGPAEPAEAGREGAGAWLRNGRLTVAVDARGVVRVGSGGLAVPSLLGFEDVGDAGDLYTPSPVGRPITTAWCDGAEVVHAGPLRAALRVRYRMRVPVALARDEGEQFARPARRAGRPAELPVAVTLVLDAEAEALRVEVRGVNTARDHRLRLRFATGVTGGTAARVLADAAFGPVERRSLLVPAEEQRAERVVPTAPLHRYVSLYAEDRGATVFSDGLAEYEALDDGAVLVTLVRAVGELSRPDLPERPGHAGWPAATPEAQSLGAFAARFAVAFHAGDSAATRALVERVADDVLLPLTGGTVRSLLDLPAPAGGLALEGEGLAFGAAAPSDDGEWVVLRCVNVTDAQVDGRWTVGAPLREARRARLDETPGAALAVVEEGGGSAVAFAAGPREVVTLLVR